MVGVISDSHDNVPMLRKAVSLFQSSGCELVVHAGDFVAPFAAQELRALGCPVKAVFGNCDGEKMGLEKALEGWGEIQEAPFVFDYSGRRFLLTHYHFSVGKYAATGNYDIIIFGHTHKPEVRKDNRILLVNPGESGGWLSGKATIALLDLPKLEAEVVYL